MITWKNYFLYQIDYQHWANDQLLSCLDNLSDEARKNDEALLYKNIHGTLNHVLVTNLVWSARLRGENSELTLESQLHDDWRSLKSALRQTLRQLQHWLEMQPQSFFEGKIHYRFTGDIEYSNWVPEILTHIAMHNAHHRGLITAVAVRLGAAMPEIQYLSYRRDMQETLTHSKQALDSTSAS